MQYIIRMLYYSIAIYNDNDAISIDFVILSSLFQKRYIRGASEGYEGEYGRE